VGGGHLLTSGGESSGGEGARLISTYTALASPDAPKAHLNSIESEEVTPATHAIMVRQMKR
jgi:hypothetical protein